MASAILIAPPPLDTVLLWLSSTIERDFDERAVFPGLRHAHAVGYRGAATLHLLSAREAEAVLEDATAREQSVRRGARNAYRALIKSIKAAVEEATERPAAFASPEAVCVHKSDSGERWRGTKAQIKAQGVQLNGPWPHEPGGKARWAQARDSRGYKTSITRFSSVWPGLYEAYIAIPYEVWGQKYDQRPNAADVARRGLASMPRSDDDFRAHLVDYMRMFARVNLDLAINPSPGHGYTLDEDAVSEIHASFDAVAEAIVGARVNFDSALHAEIAQKYRAQIAAADHSFQAQFKSLVRPNHRILDGSAQ